MDVVAQCVHHLYNVPGIHSLKLGDPLILDNWNRVVPHGFMSAIPHFTGQMAIGVVVLFQEVSFPRAAAGDRTRIYRVTGGDTDHYTTATTRCNTWPIYNL
jgi:hypothetical protein